MTTAGIDCGAQNTKCVVLRNGGILGRAMEPTGFEPARAAEASLAMALQQAGIAGAALRRIGATGSGRPVLRIAAERVNAVKAMAKGARHFFPAARTVVDVGAEESRAVRLDDDGNAVDFAVNERCAAGAGAFIEAMARALEVTVEAIGPLSLESAREIPMNAQCAIFAESEVIGMIHSNIAKADISRAIHDAIAGRIASIVRRIGVQADVVLIGGLARNPGLRSSLVRQLKGVQVHVPADPEYGAAVGAALAAAG